MKKRQKSELGTFSVSAIDLFAAALGAFIVIAILLFPYFPKTEDMRPLIIQLEQQIQTLTAENVGLKDGLADAMAANAALKSEVDRLQQLLDEAKAAAAAAQSAQAQAVEKLQGQLAGAAFIGIEPAERTFQIAIDMSGSMADDQAAVTAARLGRTIMERLRDGDKLRILTFQGNDSAPRITVWPAGGQLLTIASDNDRNAAARHVSDLLSNPANLIGGTPTFRVLDDMLAQPGPGTIILITDGIPNAPAGSSIQSLTQAVQEATQRNRNKHQINIVALGQFIASPVASAITALATGNGGALVAIP